MINKQHISFPKAPRFTQLRKSPDLPYYNIPSSIRQRSISIGQRTPLKIYNISPSPQHYNLGNTRSPMAKSFGVGREVQSIQQVENVLTKQIIYSWTLKKIAYSIRPKYQIKTESSIFRSRLKTIM